MVPVKVAKKFLFMVLSRLYRPTMEFRVTAELGVSISNTEFDVQTLL